jgi:hypothetical protein
MITIVVQAAALRLQVEIRAVRIHRLQAVHPAAGAEVRVAVPAEAAQAEAVRVVVALAEAAQAEAEAAEVREDKCPMSIDPKQRINKY